MGIDIYRLTRQNVTIEIDDHLRPYLGLDTPEYQDKKELTVHCSDWACRGGDYWAERDGYYGAYGGSGTEYRDPEDGPMHKRIARAEERLSSYPKETPLLGLCYTDKPYKYPKNAPKTVEGVVTGNAEYMAGTGARTSIGREVEVAVEEAPPTWPKGLNWYGYPVYARLSEAAWCDTGDGDDKRRKLIGYIMPNFQKKTRRKWILTNETIRLGKASYDGGPMKTRLGVSRVVYTHGPLTADCCPVEEYRVYEEGTEKYDEYMAWYGTPEYLAARENWSSVEFLLGASPPVGSQHMLTQDEQTAKDIANWTEGKWTDGNGFKNARLVEEGTFKPSEKVEPVIRSSNLD